MDKLKKFQPYQFWVLLAIAVILPLVGWFMARSGFVSQAQAQEDALKKLSDSLAFSTEDPNQDWEQKLNALNAVQEKQVRIAWEHLYNLQKQRMVWPKTVGQDPAKFELKEQNYYRNAYAAEVERVWRVLNPIVYAQDGTKSGIVEFPFEAMPRYDEIWENQSRAPTIKEMEASQEDLWLLTTLFQSIAKVNENSTSPYDSVVRAVGTLILRGGSTNFPGSGGGGGGMMPSAAGGMDPAMAGGSGGSGGMMPGMNDSMGMGGGLGGGSSATPTFDPSDEFGLETAAADAVAAAGTAMPGSAAGGMDPMSSMLPMSGGSFGDMGGGKGRASMQFERYVTQNEKWKTRGFYIELVIDHTRLPDVLVALSNSDWPVRITRVQQTDLQEEELVDAAAGGVAGGLPGAMPGAMPGDIGSGRSFAPAGMGSAMGGGMGGAMGGGMGSGFQRQSINRPMGNAGIAGGVEGGFTNEPDPLDDPILAHVAISGLITLYKAPPPEAAPVQDPAQADPSTQGQGAEPAPTAAVPAATPPAEAVATETAPTEKPADAAAKPEAEKSDVKAGDAPAAGEPAKGANPAPAEGTKPAGSG